MRLIVQRGVVVWMCGALVCMATAQTVTVDNVDPEFTLLYGEWNIGEYGQPYGTNYNWAETTGYGGGVAPAEAEWRPNLPATGAYTVSIWYVQGGNRADNATFTIHHAEGSTPIEVNQQINGETWVELGAFSFNAGTAGSVTLHNDAHASVVIADAVRFTRATTTVELTMVASPSAWGTTTPAPGGPYTYYLNEQVPISANSFTGYEFDHWEVNGGANVAEPWSASTTVLMDQNKYVTATFIEQSAVESEFRGFWADAFHIGFKSQSEIDDMVARAVEGNYNAILPEVLAFQDTGANGHGSYWDSDIVPRASDIIGSFDPLAYLVEQAHANNIEVHPWLVAFRVCSSWPPAGNALVAAHPEWLMVVRDDMGGGPAQVNSYYTFDPGSPDVQEYLMSIVRELVDNYEIDGIHWDYIRYTTTEAGYPAYTWYDYSGLERFKAISGYGGTPATDYGPWSDFRRRGITEVIRRAQAEMASADNPRQPLRHSAALITWGNAPANFEDTNAYQYFQNWRHWMEEGYIDTAIPMTYYDWDVYPSYYRNWVDQSLEWRFDRHLVTGPATYLNSFANSIIEIDYALNAGADGICTYSYTGTDGSRTDWNWYPYVAANAFIEPTVTPAMSWRDPITATRGNIFGRVTDGATGTPLDDATVNINGFPLAQTDGNGFFLLSDITAPEGGVELALSASYPGYADAARPFVLLERAGYTEANLALGDWLAGDYDVDGDVDLADLDHMISCLTAPDNGPPAAGCDLFDFDLDHDVDLADFAVLQASFGS
ncbi:MAG: family 10 glycosylhydrolase [Planctomycetota bacterium]